MLSIFALAASAGLAQVQDYRPDLDFLIDALRQNGAYVVQDHVDLRAIRDAYSARFQRVTDKRELLALLENVVAELHDFHASLGTNNDASPRLVPSGADLYAHWEGDKAVIEQVRSGSLAESAGVAPGAQVLLVDGKPVREGCRSWFGVRTPDKRAWKWALNSALAGRWNRARRLTLLSNGRRREVTLATAAEPKPDGVLKVEHRGKVLYLRPENSLGESALIGAFEKVVPDMRKASRVVIDLRSTPSGGNTAVARGIIGLFVGKRLPYQRHRVEERETGTVRDWVEYVIPRLEHPIRTPLVVLVGRWTGSMGEGIAIGFDAMHRATVIGTKMARLRGAIERIELPMSRIGVAFPTEQVFHTNGTPRHEWLPPILVEPGNGDAWWRAAAHL